MDLAFYNRINLRLLRHLHRLLVRACLPLCFWAHVDANVGEPYCNVLRRTWLPARRTCCRASST